jgi:hypothetical protein
MTPATNVLIDPVFDDPEQLRTLFREQGPYWNQGRYLSAAGAASQMPSGATSTAGVPWFRQDWALAGRALVPAAAELLAMPAFAEAAATAFGGTVVRPHTVYANVQVPAPATDHGHVDVPEFRGARRDTYPVALLHLMNRSGLFARWQLSICTAVVWLWDGPGGAFLLWDRGPEDAPRRFEPPLTNRAVVADNDRVFHGIGDFSVSGGPGPEHLTPDSEVTNADGRWHLRSGGDAVGSWPEHSVRLSVSWKAYVFDDATAAQRYDEHTDDLDEERIIDIFLNALASRGVPFSGPPVLGEPLLFALAEAWPKPLPTGV